MAGSRSYCVARASEDLAVGRASNHSVHVHNAALVDPHDTCDRMEFVGAAHS